VGTSCYYLGSLCQRPFKFQFWKWNFELNQHREYPICEFCSIQGSFNQGSSLKRRISFSSRLFGLLYGFDHMLTPNLGWLDLLHVVVPILSHSLPKRLQCDFIGRGTPICQNLAKPLTLGSGRDSCADPRSHESRLSLDLSIWLVIQMRCIAINQRIFLAYVKVQFL